MVRAGDKIKFWTQYEIARVEELRLLGFTHQEIGDKLGRTQRSISCMLHKLARPAEPKRDRRRFTRTPAAFDSAELARELQARGWTVHPPDVDDEAPAPQALQGRAAGARHTCLTPTGPTGGVHLW